MSDKNKQIKKTEKSKNTVRGLVLDRIGLFILAVLTIMSAFAWNDYFREVLVNKRLPDDEKTALLRYALIMTGILILFIIIYAFLYHSIPEGKKFRLY